MLGLVGQGASQHQANRKNPNENWAKVGAEVLQHRDKWRVRVRRLKEDRSIPAGSRNYSFLTSARAGYEVVSDIQRVTRRHLS